MNKEKNIIEEKNINFFSANKKYQQNVATLDTYKILYNEITNTLKKVRIYWYWSWWCFNLIHQNRSIYIDEMITQAHYLKITQEGSADIPKYLKDTAIVQCYLLKIETGFKI